jgi:hypothetical protein
VLTTMQHKSTVLRLSQSAAMSGGFLLLLCEIRFEHRAVLVDDWRPWIPIVFCGLMVMIIPIATHFWNHGGKGVLVGCYCLTASMGVLGLVFHSEGHLMQRLIEVFSVWSSTIQAGAAINATHPPLLAPAAFVGLGFIGCLFMLEEKLHIREKLITGGDSIHATVSQSQKRI